MNNETVVFKVVGGSLLCVGVILMLVAVFSLFGALSPTQSPSYTVAESTGAIDAEEFQHSSASFNLTASENVTTIVAAQTEGQQLTYSTTVVATDEHALPLEDSGEFGEGTPPYKLEALDADGETVGTMTVEYESGNLFMSVMYEYGAWAGVLVVLGSMMVGYVVASFGHRVYHFEAQN